MGPGSIAMEYDARKKSIVVAYLLWMFFSPFSAHRFYLRAPVSGIWMLLLNTFCFLYVLLGWMGGNFRIWAAVLVCWPIMLLLETIWIARRTSYLNRMVAFELRSKAGEKGLSEPSKPVFFGAISATVVLLLGIFIATPSGGKMVAGAMPRAMAAVSGLSGLFTPSRPVPTETDEPAPRQSVTEKAPRAKPTVTKTRTATKKKATHRRRFARDRADSEDEAETVVEDPGSDLPDDDPPRRGGRVYWRAGEDLRGGGYESEGTGSERRSAPETTSGDQFL